MERPSRLPTSWVASAAGSALSSSGGSGTDTAISTPSEKGGTSSRRSPLQKRPGSYQLGGRSVGSNPIDW